MKTFYKFYIYLFSTVLIPTFIFSQEEFATSTAFHTVTPEYFNPAFTGERRVLSMSTLYYDPYVGVDAAPSMQLLSVNSPMRRFSPVSFGGIIVRSPISYVQYNRIYADFSYSVKMGHYFSESRLYFGFRFGATNYSVVSPGTRSFSAVDPFLPNNSENQPSTGFGIAYKVSIRDRYHYRIGFALPSIVRAEGVVYTTTTFILMGNIPFARRMVFTPSMLIWKVKGSKTRFSFNTFISLTNYSLIMGYDDGVVLAGLGMLVKPQMYVGAAYRFSNAIQNVSSNAGFELSMRYDVFGRRNLGMKYNYANGGMFRTY